MGLFRKITDECFSCHKKLEPMDKWGDKKHILHFGYMSPKGMSKHDKLCRSCLDNIKNTQVKEIQLKGKYVKELPVKKSIIGSYIPVWALMVAIDLGWRYGTLLFLSNIALIWGVGIIGTALTYSDNFYMEMIGIVLILSIFPLHGLITWYLIKKHNARVRANKN